MAVAATSPDMFKAAGWIHSGHCIVMDDDALDQLGRTLGIDWETQANGERMPAPFNKDAIDLFLSRFVRVDAFTLRKTDSVWTDKYILVSPSLMSGDTFSADKNTLSRSILVAKQVFERAAPNKYEITGKLDFMRAPTVLSGAVAELKIGAVAPGNVPRFQGHQIRFLDFKA